MKTSTGDTTTAEVESCPPYVPVGLDGEIHESFSKLISLRKLNLPYNRLKNISVEFHSSMLLQEIDLQYNILHSLPRSLGDLPYLTSFKIYPDYHDDNFETEVTGNTKYYYEYRTCSEGDGIDALYLDQWMRGCLDSYDTIRGPIPCLKSEFDVTPYSYTKESDDYPRKDYYTGTLANDNAPDAKARYPKGMSCYY